MVVFCPECGAENSDRAFNCASCGWPLRPSTDSVATMGGGEQGQPVHEDMTGRLPGNAGAWRSSAKMMIAAETLAVLGAVLLLASFALLVHYYETVMEPGHSIEDWQKLEDVVKAMQYTMVFGEFMAILGVVLVLGGVMHTGAAPVAEYMRRASLSGVLGLAIVMTALTCVAAVATVLLYEGEGSEDLDRVLGRLSLYMRPLAEALLVVLLVVVTDGLRRGVLDTRPDRPGPQPVEAPQPWKPQP
jgi:hypothetical protein